MTSYYFARYLKFLKTKTCRKEAKEKERGTTE